MSLTLKDLRVITRHSEGLAGVNKTRYATLADLVEVLKQEGAYEVGHFDHHDNEGAFVAARAYLVLPLEDNPNDRP